MEHKSVESWRMFVAIELPESVKGELSHVQAEMRGALSSDDVRWSRPEQFHLTLKFLGQVEADSTIALVDSLQHACRGFPELSLCAEGVGFFPNERSPRVIWTGVRDRAEVLPLLQQTIEEAVRDFTSEKPENHFVGHVTLGRCQSIRHSDLEALSHFANRKNLKFGDWTARNIQLIRSELLPQGSRYSVVATIPLATEPPFGTLPPE